MSTLNWLTRDEDLDARAATYGVSLAWDSSRI